MGVKTGDVVSSSTIKQLVADLITIYNNRGLTVNGKNLRNLSFWVNYVPDENGNKVEIAIEQGDPITKKDLGNIVRKVLVINEIPSLKDAFDTEPYKSQSGLLAFFNGTSTDLSTWASNLKTITVQNETSTNHGCRGACVGLCSGGCYGQGHGRAASSSGSYVPKGSDWTNTTPKKPCSGCSTGCSVSCGTSCSSTCYSSSSIGSSGTCKSGCVGGCNRGCANQCSTACNNCTGNCYNGCGGSCRTNCSGTCAGCSGGCGSGCTGCGSSCGSGCGGSCNTACETTCKNGCATDCNAYCFGGAK